MHSLCSMRNNPVHPTGCCTHPLNATVWCTTSSEVIFLHPDSWRQFSNDHLSRYSCGSVSVHDILSSVTFNSLMHDIVTALNPHPSIYCCFSVAILFWFVPPCHAFLFVTLTSDGRWPSMVIGGARIEQADSWYSGFCAFAIGCQRALEGRIIILVWIIHCNGRYSKWTMVHYIRSLPAWRLLCMPVHVWLPLSSAACVACGVDCCDCRLHAETLMMMM